MTSPVIITKDPVEVNFIQRIQNTFGLDPEQIIDVNDPLTKLTLAIAITTIEQGENNYSYDQYVKGIAKSTGMDAADLDEQLNVTSLPFENNTGAAGFVSPATNLISSGKSSVGSGARLDVGAYVSITSTPIVPVTMAEIGGIGNYIQSGVNTVTGYFGGGTANQNNSTTIIPGTRNSNSEAQYVLLSTGTNSWGSNPAAVQNQINSTIQSLRDKGYNPGNIVMLLPPKTVNGTSTAYDAALAAAREKGIATINVPSDTADGLHYTVAGNQRVLQAFSEVTGQSTEALKGNTLVIGDSRAVLANRALNSNPDLAVQGLNAEQILNRTQSVPTATTTIIPGTPGSGDIAVRELPPPVSTNPNGSQSATPSQNANIINQAPSPAAVGLPEGSTVTPLYQVNSSGPTQLLQVTYKSPDGNTRILDARTGVVKSENGEVLGTAREVPLDQTNLRTQIESGGNSPSSSAVLFTPSGQQENTTQQQTLTATYTAPGGEAYSVTSNVTSTTSQQLQPLVDRNNLISTEITSLREQNATLKADVVDLDQRIQAAQAAGEPTRPLVIQQAQTQIQIVNNQERIINLGAEKQAIDAKLENPTQPVGEQSAIFNDRINELQAKIDNPEGIPAGEYLASRAELADLKATQSLLDKPIQAAEINSTIDTSSSIEPAVAVDFNSISVTQYNPPQVQLDNNAVTSPGSLVAAPDNVMEYQFASNMINVNTNTFGLPPDPSFSSTNGIVSPVDNPNATQSFDPYSSSFTQSGYNSFVPGSQGSLSVQQNNQAWLSQNLPEGLSGGVANRTSEGLITEYTFRDPNTGQYTTITRDSPVNAVTDYTLGSQGTFQPNPAGQGDNTPLQTDNGFQNAGTAGDTAGFAGDPNVLGVPNNPNLPTFAGLAGPGFGGTANTQTREEILGGTEPQSNVTGMQNENPLPWSGSGGDNSSTPGGGAQSSTPSTTPAGGAPSPAAPGGATASAAQQQGMAKGC